MKNTRKRINLLVLVGFFLAFNFYRLGNRDALAETTASEIQDKIENIEEKKEKTEKTLQTAQQLLDKNISRVNYTQSLIKKSETEIAKKEAELNNLDSRLELNKSILREFLREVYYSDLDDYIIKLAITSDNLNNLIENTDNLIGAKEKVLFVLDDIYNAKEEIGRTKEELAEKKGDHEKLLNVQKGEQIAIKTDIYEAQADLSELNAKLSKLKSELSSLLGGNVSTKNIVDAANFASKATGVRKDYLLGVLVVESNLGRYTGGCNFKQSKMSGARAAIFKDICKELNYDYTKKKVSCPPSGYKGTGGAMGVAQFMPDTWSGYKNSISNITHNDPPDPWNLIDGVTAMALKLAKVSGVTDHKKSAEAKAYCVYLAGGNWQAYCDDKGTNYGKLVLYWADNYEKKLGN
jgi:peptidoglycan hydrolase CwlO-like protein